VHLTIGGLREIERPTAGERCKQDGG